MRCTVEGIEFSAGVGKTSQKAYEIGQLHVTVPLAAPFGPDGIAKGKMGTTFRASRDVIESIKHNSVPFEADLELQVVMKFGKPETTLIGVRPVGFVGAAIPRKAA